MTVNNQPQSAFVHPARLRILPFVFALSGAASLTFETLWFRQLGNALGNQVWTATLVFAAFMAGMAVGYGLAARLGDRIRQPLRAYAVAELIVALIGVGLVMLLPLIPNGLAESEIVTRWPAGQLHVIRLLVSFLLLLIPAVAMGATLPLLVRALQPRLATRGVALGSLYAWNTAGAATGTLLTEWWLIGQFGVFGTAIVAAALAVLAAMLAMSIQQNPQPRIIQTPQGLRDKCLLAASALAGAVFLALEPVWFRLLLLSNRGTGETFAIMLAVLLVGLALGAAVMQRLLRRHPDAAQRIGIPTGMACVGTLLGFHLFASDAIQGCCGNESISTLIQTMVLILPCAIASGSLLPMLCAQAEQQWGPGSRAAGRITAANALGGACGALISGLWLLAVVGIEISIVVLAVSYVLIVTLFPERLHRLAPIAITILLTIWLMPPTSVVQRQLDRAAAPYARHASVIAVREGMQETAQLLERRFMGEPIAWRLVTNSYSMSNTERDSRRYMKLYAWLPLAIHPGMQSALLISYGVGSTAKALTDTGELLRIDVVDPSASILGMSRLIHGDQDPLLDSRVQVHLEDGRFYLATTTQRYDLITGEPPPPRLAGIQSLYSREYFELIRKRLKPKGIASYWLPVDQLDLRSAQAVMAAFCAAFPDCSLWAGSNYNFMLLGSNGLTKPVTEARFAAQWSPPADHELTVLGFESPQQLGATFLADADELLQRIGQTPPLTDNWPKRLSPRPTTRIDLETYDRWRDPERNAIEFQQSAWIGAWWPAAMREQTTPMFAWQPILNNEFNTERGDPLPLIDRLLMDTDLRIPVLWLLGSDVREQRILDQLMTQTPSPAWPLPLAIRALAERDFGVAARLLDQHHRQQPFQTVRLHLYALCRANRMDSARELATAWQQQTGQQADFSCW